MHITTIIRDYLGLTQHDLAHMAGITQADLCEIETRSLYGYNLYFLVREKYISWFMTSLIFL